VTDEDIFQMRIAEIENKYRMETKLRTYQELSDEKVP